MKKLTEKFLEEKNACEQGRAYARMNGLIGNPIDTACEKLLANGETDYADWLLSRSLTKKDCVKYAIFAAEQVLHIYEEKYPDDKRPREAITAAKEYLKHQTKKNKEAAYAAHAAAYAAADAAYAAADAAYVAYAAAYAAAHAAAYAAYVAYAAAHAAHAAADAAYVAYAAYAAAHAAAYAAADAAYAAAHAAAYAEIKKRIIEYGIEILRGIK